MRKPMLIALSLICALAISGCERRGVVRPPVPACKVLQPVPANIKQRIDYKKKVLDELIEPSPSSKPSATPR